MAASDYVNVGNPLRLNTLHCKLPLFLSFQFQYERTPPKVFFRESHVLKSTGCHKVEAANAMLSVAKSQRILQKYISGNFQILVISRQ